MNYTNRGVWVFRRLLVVRGATSAYVDLIYRDPSFICNHDSAAPIGSISAGAAFNDIWMLSDTNPCE